MIFFDLDGTLLDHKNSECLGVRAFYHKYKHELQFGEEAFYEIWIKASNKYFYKYLKGEMTFKQQQIDRVKEVFSFSHIKISDKDAQRRFGFYVNKYEENWKQFQDVIPCLRKLSEYKLGIISNGDLGQQTLKLERLGIKDYFGTIITAGDVGTAKPDTKLFEIACARVNEDPKNCYYIGDDLETDILPCIKIGMNGIWLNRNDKKIYSSDIVMINSLNELQSILFT